MAKERGRNNTMSQFEFRWGIHALDLAESEGVTADAIHMRVFNYGTPYQRSAKPTTYERVYGATLRELAIEHHTSPYTIQDRHKTGVPLDTPLTCKNRSKPDPENWPTITKRGFWLHPEHPGYTQARAGKLTDSDIAQICALGKKYHK